MPMPRLSLIPVGCLLLIHALCSQVLPKFSTAQCKWPQGVLSPDRGSCTIQRKGLWTHAPFCADTRYCVFTAANFQKNHGISIITTRTLNKALPILQAALNSTGSAEKEPPPYETREIPGKGKGLVATSHIRRGSIFMVDYAALVVELDFMDKVAPGEVTDLVKRAVTQLPEPDMVLSLGKSLGDVLTPAEDVLRTNAFMSDIAGRPYLLLLPRVSRINHACNPNAYTNFFEERLSMRVMAFRDIEPGEEVTITYTDFGLAYGERRAQLEHRWGFQCTCDMCAATVSEIGASDKRRQRLAELRSEMMHSVSVDAYSKALAIYDEVLILLRKENLAEHFGEHYMNIAKMRVSNGDKKTALKFASKALAEIEDFNGPLDFEPIDEIRKLIAELSP